MLRDTLDRLRPSAPPERTLVLTNSTLRNVIAAMEPEIPSENIIAEPRPAGTCAALAWAAHVIAARDGDEAVMVCTHADWAIGDVPSFRTTLDRAAMVAFKTQALVTVGIIPDRADPGFGYIQPGEAVDDGVRRVHRFVEKPTRERATEMVSGGYLWNSGIFAWRVGDFLSEIHEHTPEVQQALDLAPDDLDTFFNSVIPIAVDVGVLERSSRVLMLAGQFGWDDVGTWASLYRVRSRDSERNAMLGKAWAVESNGNVVHAENTSVVLYGVNDLVVVAMDGITMVTTREKASDLKALLEALPPDVRER